MACVPNMKAVLSKLRLAIAFSLGHVKLYETRLPPQFAHIGDKLQGESLSETRRLEMFRGPANATTTGNHLELIKA